MPMVSFVYKSLYFPLMAVLESQEDCEERGNAELDELVRFKVCRGSEDAKTLS